MLPKITTNIEIANRRFPSINLDCRPFDVEGLTASLIYVKNGHALEFYFEHRGFLFRIKIDQDSFRLPPAKRVNEFTIYGDKFSRYYTHVNIDGTLRAEDFEFVKTIIIGTCDAMIIAAIHDA